MFQPVLYRLKVKPDTVEEKTAGGIIIPQGAANLEQKAGMTGTVVAIGEGAFDGQDVVKVGDRILYVKYAGTLFTENGEEFRYINDEDCISVCR